MGSNSRLPSGWGAGSGPMPTPKPVLLGMGLVSNGAGG